MGRVAMTFRRLSARAKLLLESAALVLLSLSVVFILAETAFRVKDALYPLELSPIVEPQKEYGWQARTNFRFVHTRRDAENIPHDVEIITDENGFRMFGGPATDGCRVLFIGDSYTFAEDATQSETYYAVAAAKLGLNAFAYGAQGFSTLQEYLILDTWLERINPDQVVLQFCHNDFINNSLELTRLSARGQCHVDQPYLSSDGGICYRNPGHGPFSSAVSRIPSRLLHSLAYRIDNRKGIPSRGNSIEHIVEREGLNFAPFVNAIDTTDRLLAMFRERCGDTPLIVFNVDSREPYASAFNRICAKHSIEQITGIPEALDAASRDGVTVFAEDQLHWTGAGHKICGELLAEKLQLKCPG